MKRLVFFIAAAGMLAACKHDPVEGIPQTGNLDMNNVVTTRTLSVPVETGRVAVVRSGGQVLATADSPAEVLVPKDAPIEIRQLTPEEFNLTGLEVNTSRLWQVIAFEDSRHGDYDYNDLVIHVKYESRKSNWYENTQVVRVAVHPVALGSTKTIALGYDVYAGTEKVKSEMVTQDCRATLFGGRTGMLNTLTKNFDCDYFVYKNSTDDPILCPAGRAVAVNWFIIVDGGVRLNALSTVYTTSLVNADNRPYGIVTTHTGYQYTQEDQGIVGLDWFNYPKENVSIDKVYPEFGRWLVGEYTGTFQSMYSDDKENSFNAAGLGVYVLASPVI